MEVDPPRTSPSESETASSLVENVNNFDNLKKFYQTQLASAHEQLLLKEAIEDGSETKDAVEEEIEAKINKVENKIQIKQIQDDIIKKLGFANEGLKACFSELTSELSSDLELAERHKLRDNLSMHKTAEDLVSQLLKENEDLDTELILKKKRLEEIVKGNSEKLALLKHVEMSAGEDEVLRFENDNAEILEAKQEYTNEVKKLRSVKYIFQSLITACNIDWFEDEQMRELYLSLGQPCEVKTYKSDEPWPLMR